MASTQYTQGMSVIHKKPGRPTKYSARLPAYVIEYIENCKKSDIFPTIEGLATTLHVGTRTIYDWELGHVEFSQTLGLLRDLQRELLITKTLDGSYNTRFSIFLLKATHGMTEKDTLVSNTQNNNYMNISPDILADAIKLMERNE
jgi:hypothetical protein